MMYYFIVNLNTGKAFVKSKDFQEMNSYCKQLQALGHNVKLTKESI